MTAKKSSLRFLDYFFVLRPMLFYPGWSTLLAGYLLAAQKPLLYSYPADVDYGKLAVLLFIFALAMGSCFLINQMQDVDSDRRNRKLFIVAEGHISLSAARAEILVMLTAAVLTAFYFSALLGWITTAFLLVTGYLYNYPPFVFKDYPWRSLLANALMGWLAFALGWAGKTNHLDIQMLLGSLPYLFLNTALYLFTTLPDRAGDAGSAKKTLAVRYGLTGVIRGAFALYLLGLVSAVWFGDMRAMVILVPAGPFFLMTLRNNDVQSAVRSTKFTILFFAVAVCLYLPVYFVLMALGFFLTRWYFKQRFGYDYPNFKGV